MVYVKFRVPVKLCSPTEPQNIHRTRLGVIWRRLLNQFKKKDTSCALPFVFSKTLRKSVSSSITMSVSWVWSIRSENDEYKSLEGIRLLSSTFTGPILLMLSNTPERKPPAVLAAFDQMPDCSNLAISVCKN